MGGSTYKQVDERLLRPGFPLQGSVIKSTRRTIEVFEFFAEFQRPANVAAVARALNYPASSTSALLKSLTRMGYLEYDRESRLYYPTLRISLLGGWIQDQYFHDNNILTLIRSLAKKTRGTVMVAMQNSVFAQYLLFVDARDTMRAYARTGSLRPICRSATGRMLLTLKSDEEVRGIVTHANALEPDPGLRVKFRELITELRKCRQQGYALTSGNVTPGRGVVAMLLPTRPGHLPMSIGVGALTEDLRASKDEWIHMMRQELAEYRP